MIHFNFIYLGVAEIVEWFARYFHAGDSDGRNSRQQSVHHANTTESKLVSHMFGQVMNERLGNAVAEHRFRSKMAKIAAACGMDGLGSRDDDAK